MFYEMDKRDLMIGDWMDGVRAVLGESDTD